MGGDGQHGPGQRLDPAQGLAYLDDLRRRVRADRAGPAPWALAAMAVAVLGAAVVYQEFPAVSAVIVPGSGGGYRVPREDGLANLGGSPPHVAAGVYWVVVTPLVWAFCGWVFRRRHALGLGRPWWHVTTLGLVPFAALVAGQFVLAPRLEVVHHLLADPDRRALPVAAIGLGLVLVGALQRVPALVACGALAAVLPLVPIGPGGLVDLVEPGLHLGHVTWLVADLGIALLTVASVLGVVARLRHGSRARWQG